MSMRVRANRPSQFYDSGDEFDVLDDSSPTKIVINYQGRPMPVTKSNFDIIVPKKAVEIDYMEITRNIAGG